MVKAWVPNLKSRNAKVIVEPQLGGLFDDALLELEIRKVLGNLRAELTSADLMRVLHLDLDRSGVRSLAGIEKLGNLRSLGIEGTEVSDLRPLKSLEKIRMLRMSDSKVGSLEELRGKTSIETLFIRDLPISDFSPLQSMKGIVELRAEGNESLDLKHLAALTNLKDLRLSRCGISEGSVLAGLVNLERLELGGNQIADFSWMSSLNRLRFLDVSENPGGGGWAALGALQDLETLKMDGLRSVDGDLILAGKRNLRSLSFRNGEFAKLESVPELPLLEELLLVGAPGREFVRLFEGQKFVDHYPHLKTLQLVAGNLESLTSLAGLPGIRELNLENNMIADTLPLTGAKELETLILRRNRISKLGNLNQLSKLVTLDLSANRIEELPDPSLISFKGKLLLRSNPVSFSDPEALKEWAGRLEGFEVDSIGDVVTGGLIRDLVLERAVRNQLEIFSRELLADDLMRLKTVSLKNAGVESLEGMQHAKSLKFLELPDNQIQDVSPISALPALESLNLSRNPVGNIEAIGGLGSLRQLWLTNVAVSEKAAFLGGLKNLVLLEAPGCGIRDLAWANEGVSSRMEILRIARNELRTLAGLERFVSLQEFDGSRNFLADSETAGQSSAILEGLRRQKLKLIRMDELEKAPVYGTLVKDPQLEKLIRSRLGVLGGALSQADLLRLKELVIPPKFSVAKLDGLEEAKNLSSLTIRENEVSNLSPLGECSGLTRLVVEKNPISDLSTIAGCRTLRELQLVECQVSDIASLGGMTELNTLVLRGNQIGDLSSLKSLGKLNLLVLGTNQIKSLAPIADLVELKHLGIAHNPVDDPSVISKLTGLEVLYIDGVSMKDIEWIRPLSRLRVCELSETGVKDISPLEGLSKLTFLGLAENPVEDLRPIFGMKELTKVKFSGIANFDTLRSGEGFEAFVREIEARGGQVEF